MKKRPQYLDAFLDTSKFSVDEYFFDEDAADLAVIFIEKHIKHTKGKWKGKPFILLPWQKKIVRDLFGWKRVKDGLRRFRTVFIIVGKKNGKSTLAAAIALYALVADGEPSAEVYGVASDSKQAKIVHNMAKSMISQDEKLSEITESYGDSVTHPISDSFYVVSTSNPDTKDGISPSCVIFDELHRQQNRELWDVMTSGGASRDQPIVFVITTAGTDRTSICYEQYQHAKKVRDGLLNDPKFYPVIFEADKDDDWRDPKTWAKACPSLGETVQLEFYEDLVRTSEDTPGYLNTFLRLYLNIWTTSENAWIKPEVWAACGWQFGLDDLIGRKCYGGLDLAATRDIASLALVFPPDDDWEDWAAIMYHYMAKENLQSEFLKSQGNYAQWEKKGYITGTEGNIIDYDWIKRDIENAAENVNLVNLAIDRWNSVHIMNQLQAENIPCMPYGQGFRSFALPTAELNKLLISENFAHDSNPVTAWMASNVIIEIDAAGNMKPSKKKSTEKIDGIVALIMGVGAALLDAEGDKKSKYETESLATI